MAKNRRKKSSAKSTQLSPEKYIVQKGRDLDFYECLINEDWQKSGLAIVSICKKMPSGNFVTGTYLLDIYCLGLKNTLYKFNMSELEYQEFIEKSYANSVGNLEKMASHYLLKGQTIMQH